MEIRNIDTIYNDVDAIIGYKIEVFTTEMPKLKLGKCKVTQ